MYSVGRWHVHVSARGVWKRTSDLELVTESCELPSRGDGNQKNDVLCKNSKHS